MIELYAIDMHFLGNDEQIRSNDLCVHGNTYLNINGVVISDKVEENSDFCVSASALRFLRSLFGGHESGHEEQLIPCCGYMMVPAEDGKSVEIIGCPDGIDFDVKINGEKVLIVLEDKTELELGYEEYKSAVLKFAEQVGKFYESSTKRVYFSDYEKQGFMAFIYEYRELYNKALGLFA